LRDRRQRQHHTEEQDDNFKLMQAFHLSCPLAQMDQGMVRAVGYVRREPVSIEGAPVGDTGRKPTVHAVNRNHRR
jgi:hypothetical protein